jgi:hypothetical protein
MHGQCKKQRPCGGRGGKNAGEKLRVQRLMSGNLYDHGALIKRLP